MTEATKIALEEVEPVDPGHYFAAVEAQVGVAGAERTETFYGLTEAEFPDEIQPVDIDNKRVVVAEDVLNAEDQGPQPVLTLVLGQANPDEAHQEAHAEILLNKTSSEFEPNRAADNPGDARMIIKRAMEKYGLDRVTTTPRDVAGTKARYFNAAHFLIEAGFNSVEDPESTDTFELFREEPAITKTSTDSAAEPELLAA